jgi:hypothetical protein
MHGDSNDHITVCMIEIMVAAPDADHLKTEIGRAHV